MICRRIKRMHKKDNERNRRSSKTNGNIFPLFPFCNKRSAHFVHVQFLSRFWSLLHCGIRTFFFYFFLFRSHLHRVILFFNSPVPLAISKKLKWKKNYEIFSGWWLGRSIYRCQHNLQHIRPNYFFPRSIDYFVYFSFACRKLFHLFQMGC